MKACQGFLASVVVGAGRVCVELRECMREGPVAAPRLIG